MGWDGLPRIDVEKSSSHQLSQVEIASDNPSSRHLSGSIANLVAQSYDVACVAP